MSCVPTGAECGPSVGCTPMSASAMSKISQPSWMSGNGNFNLSRRNARSSSALAEQNMVWTPRIMFASRARIDPPAAEKDVTVVQNDRLTRRDGALFLVEADHQLAITCDRNSCWLRLV